MLQLVNVASAYTTDLPEWVNVLLALFIGALQVVIHAGTPGAITPSVVIRLDNHAPEIADEGGLAAGAKANELAGLAMANPHDLDYIPAPNAHHGGSTRYEGVHRAD